MGSPRRSPRGTKLRKNQYMTKSGNIIKIKRSLSERWRALRDHKVTRKASILHGLPKGHIKRFFARLQPKRLAQYWFSREGAIMALKIVGIGTVLGFVLLVGAFAYFRKDLPNLKDISGSNLGGSVRYYDRTGKTLLWEDYDAVKRIPVKGDVAQSMKDATVAVEDKDFFKHGGFDVRGIARAGVNDLFGHGGTQGGSTITQQLVRLTQPGVGNRQSIQRKVKELIIAVELEREYSKQEILAGYLDTAPYGGIEYGVEAASRDYFQKSAKELTLDEAAMLAVIPKSPRYYSPYSSDFDKDAFLGRQHYILDLMQQQGKITKAQRDDAKKVDVLAKVKPRQSKYTGIKAPWFVLAAKKQMEDTYTDKTVKRGGWVVITTLDLNLQNLAEQQVQKGLTQVRRQGGDTAAFAAEDVKTGQMVALVGGADFSDPDHGQFNYALAPLPPGSSFKPYDYTALIENHDNFGAGSVLYDSEGPIIDPATGAGYACTVKGLPPPRGSSNCLADYDFKTPGPITLRYALGGSRNIPAVKAMLTTGVNKTIDTAEKMGLKSGYKCYKAGVDVNSATSSDEAPCYASSAIGDGAFLHLDEHVHGYATISRNGVNLPQTYILKITDSANKKIVEWKPTKGEQVVRPDSAYIVADMLSDPNASYFPAGRKPHLYNGWKFGMKTGTTNDTKDGWMIGFSTQYAAAVWVGYHTRQKEMSGFMETMTQPIWQGWMDAAHNGLTPVDRVRPSDLQTLPAFVVRNKVSSNGEVVPSPSTDLFPSWYKQPGKKTGGSHTIDTVSNKLATECTPERAKKQINDADANTFSGDIFFGSGANTASTNQTDDVHHCDDSHPTITLTAPDSCDASSVITMTVTQGTHPLSSDQNKGTINLAIDGQTVQSFAADSSPTTVSYNCPTNLSGAHTVAATVVDSVLYDGSDSKSVNFTGGGQGGQSLTLQSAKVSGGKTKFSWTGGSGSVTVYRTSDNAALCNSGSDDSCSSNSAADAPPGAQVYAKDSSGNSSNTVTVTN